jgi:hypothetical protein
MILTANISVVIYFSLISFTASKLSNLHSSRTDLHAHTAHSSATTKLSKEYFLETLVVADKTMIAYHKNMDLEQYILTVFNMARIN